MMLTHFLLLVAVSWNGVSSQDESDGQETLRHANRWKDAAQQAQELFAAGDADGAIEQFERALALAQQAHDEHSQPVVQSRLALS